mmetsp:Transcript_1626/g.2322  ORF Transcript_1626/g.2322 Transcript_1626/m.2322 type:complete len:310 (-) Transcript_1626:126-1055(-)|eukprot:CAMPEP_0198138578 /NCGR_PEP_ID=MMETSP1443-20131203/1969_1 /TAXON_ID=186043 /ORGANISM="Entomoneis sp., Strain CCMP2396" /LENGTH=309 /DNA_ID=CAMNT_0043800405 /DNA_START=112 /DNA_END=1041 /DNA_ORIENTATION=+
MDQQLEDSHITENLRLRLDGVPRLDEEAQMSFVNIIETWYYDIFASSQPRYRELRRRLQLKGIIDFTTNVTFQSQHKTRNGTVITYDQFLSYRQQANATQLEPLLVLMLPFNHNLLRERFVDELRVGSEAFKNIPTRAIIIPDVDFIGNEDYGDFVEDTEGGGQILLISALVSAIVFVLAVLLVAILRRYRKNKKAEKRNNPKYLSRQDSSFTVSGTNPKLLMRGTSSFADEPFSERSTDIMNMDVGDAEISSTPRSDAASRFAEFELEMETEMVFEVEEDNKFRSHYEPSLDFFAEPSVEAYPRGFNS